MGMASRVATFSEERAGGLASATCLGLSGQLEKEGEAATRTNQAQLASVPSCYSEASTEAQELPRCRSEPLFITAHMHQLQKKSPWPIKPDLGSKLHPGTNSPMRLATRTY